MNMNRLTPTHGEGSPDTPDLALWADAASKWVEQGDAIARVTREPSAILVDALAPSKGQKLLDVASGVGDPALALAEAVGRSGKVIATDAIPTMVAALRERAHERGLSDRMEIHHQVAEELDFAGAELDGASCRFGVMFFSDPIEACRRMAAAVRPGGRLVLVAWGPRDESPFFTSTMAVLDEVGAPELDSHPDSKTVFEFGEPGPLSTVCRQAGWKEIDDHLEPCRIWMGAAPEDLLATKARLSDKVRERCEALDAPTLARAAGLLAERTTGWTVDGVVAFPAKLRLVQARA